MLQAKSACDSPRESRSTSTRSPPDPAQLVTTGDGTGVLFTQKTRAIIWGLQTKAVQGMMDYDYVCGRQEPSVACMVRLNDCSISDAVVKSEKLF